MNEMVYVGEHRLVGEVIRLSKEKTTIQVYEETSGLKPGEEVAGAGCAISVKLAPGILNNIFDGIERPLQKSQKKRSVYPDGSAGRCTGSGEIMGDAYHRTGRRRGGRGFYHSGGAGDKVDRTPCDASARSIRNSDGGKNRMEIIRSVMRS